jgi:peptide/nickel transport system substrate-binding protein
VALAAAALVAREVLHLEPSRVARASDEVAAPRSVALSDVAKRSLRGGEPGEPVRGGTLTQTVTLEYRTLNNVTRGIGSEESICRNFLFPPLLDLDPDTLELVPMLAAARPTLSPDHLVYTWHLRPGVRWQRGLPDGTPVEVTTADVEFSWKMLSDERVPAIAARGALSAVKSVKAVDRTTFTVEVKEPYFKTEYEFGTNFRLMPAHLCEQDPAKFGADPIGRAPVGYGPYRFVSWHPKEYVELERNPDWFAADRLPYYVDRLRIRFVKDVSLLPDLFEQGELGLAAVNDVTRWEALKVDPAWAERATFHEYYLTTCIYIVWNCDHFAFQDPRVRRAMTLLFPREQVRDSKYLGHAFVLSGPWPLPAPELDPAIAPLPFDPAQATRLLAEAGFADHDGDGVLDRDGKAFRFVLKVPETTTPALDAGNLWFQEKLQRVGIEMKIEVVKTLFSEDLPKHQFDGAEVGWTSDPRDDDLFERLHSSSFDHGRNYGGYRSAECDALMEAWRREFDGKQRLDLAHRLHRRLADDAPFTFLFHPQSLVLATTKLRNVKMHRLGARWHDWWFAAP